MKKQILKMSILLTGVTLTVNAAQADFGLKDYEQKLIKHGVSWKSSSSYSFFPSIYLGFAPRIETADRIHFRLGRGNQVRLTGVIDDFTVLTYMYNLKSRYELIKKSLDQSYIQTEAQNQFEMFSKVIESEKISETIQKFESGQLSEKDFFIANLDLMKKLNPGRLFQIRLDLKKNFEIWKVNSLAAFLQKIGSVKASDYATKNPKEALVLLNDLLPGRVNIFSLSTEVLSALDKVVATNSLQDMLNLFNIATKNRYQMTYPTGSSQDCNQASCTLSVVELTAIYPNGSTIYDTKDRNGNKIPTIRESGVLSFLDRESHDVDNIRNESFYGWSPKMDYTAEGNGIHNPAVRTNLRAEEFKNLTADFSIPETHNNLWIVSRGNVSHGCTRMSTGHILEVRNIFPSSNEEMKKLKYFGNNSSDYDLYDIDGTGVQKIMGVQYYLSYGIQADEGEGYREGKFLIPESFNRDAFYAQLYGQNQYILRDQKIYFVNPYTSYFNLENASDLRAKNFSRQLKGEFELYEQNYEKDKVQLFSMSSTMMSSLSSGTNRTSPGKRLVRLFGRANSCGVFSKKYSQCKEDAYLNELKDLETKIKKLK